MYQVSLLVYGTNNLSSLSDHAIAKIIFCFTMYNDIFLIKMSGDSQYLVAF